MILALVTSVETAPPLATALTTVVDCADDGRHAKMEEWKGARAGRRGIRDVSNERAETRLIEKSYMDEEIAAIAQKHKMPRYPKIALLSGGAGVPRGASRSTLHPSHPESL